MDCLGYFIQRVFIAAGVRLNMSLSSLSICEVIIIQHYESISPWLVVSRCPVIRMLPSDLNIGLNTLNGHTVARS